jgi:hypothetical protein
MALERAYIDLLADSLRVPDTYMGDIDPQTAGMTMLGMTYIRAISGPARVQFETMLYQGARGATRGFYQYMITLKNWALADPYRRPWSLTPPEFKKALGDVGKGEVPGDSADAWWESNGKSVMAFFTIASAIVVLLPESLGAAVVVGARAATLGGAALTLDRSLGLTKSVGFPELERSYTLEARRRTWRQSI